MTQVEGGGIVLLPGEASRVQMGGFDVAFLGTGATTDGAFTLIETNEPTPMGGPPLHIHRDAAESFYVIAGAYSMHLNGRDFHCPPGSFVYVPIAMAHSFSVLEPNSRKLNLFTPSAMEGYFGELAQAIKEGVDQAGMAEIADRHAMEVLGPPPGDYLKPRE